MSPPYFNDIGKQARDVFNKGYHVGLIKLDFKTKSQAGVEFSSGVVNTTATNDVFGTLESKYKFKDYGATFTERWNTSNVISTEISLSDFCEGAKVGLDASFSTANSNKSLKLKGEYKNDFCAMNMETLFRNEGPKVTAGTVFGHKGWLLGYKTILEYTGEKPEFSNHHFVMGYVAKDFIVSSSVFDGTIYSGSIFHKVNNAIDAGVQIAYTSSGDAAGTDFGIGCKYKMCDDSILSFKVDNKATVGVGFHHKLNKCVSLFLSAQVDTTKMDASGGGEGEGGHKIGLALEFEA